MATPPAARATAPQIPEAGDPSVQGDEKGTAASQVPVTEGGFGQVIDAPNPDKDGAAATSDQIEKQRMSWTGAVEQAEVVARMTCVRQVQQRTQTYLAATAKQERKKSKKLQ